MQRFTVRSLVFLLGLLVAVGLGRSRNPVERGLPVPDLITSEAPTAENLASTLAKNVDSELKDGNSSDSNASPQGLTKESEVQVYAGSRPDARAMPGFTQAEPKSPFAALKQDELVRLVQAAAREATSKSLERLQRDALKTVPNYQNEILPVLKKESLLVLLRRFSDSDWTDWPRASFILEGNPTPARTYVNDVFIVNEDLGRFLETAALLFYITYASGSEGKIISPEQALERVFAQSNRLLAYRAPKAIPPRDMLDPEILSLSFVRERFKQLQNSLVLRFIRNHPGEYQLHFELLSGLSDDAVNAETNEVLAELLQRFSLEASPKFREEILKRVRSGQALSESVRTNSRVARALAHLFLVGTLDALDAGEPRKASLYLDESYAYDPRLPSQEVVASALRQAHAQLLQKKKAQAQQQPVEKGSAKTQKSAPAGDDGDSLQLLSDNSSRKTETQAYSSFIDKGVMILIYLLFGILILGGGFILHLYRQRINMPSTPVEDLDPKVDTSPSVDVTRTNAAHFNSDKTTSITSGSAAQRAHLRAASSGG